MKIREYRFSDAEAHAEVHRKSVLGLASEDYPKEVVEAWASREPEDSPLEDEKIRFVAEEDGEIIGFSDYDRETNELSGLYVKPDHTGEGIGKKLLKKLEEDARRNSLDKLWCKSTFTARDFYLKHGYELIEETNHEMEDVEMTVFKMEKQL
jgi:putative acetyltransferase